MARDRERRGKDSKAADRRRTPKKKVSILNQDSIDWVDYKDVNLLRRFMSERAKIRARRVTGNNAQQQREVARAIRVAREMALLPYSVRQVTQRSRSGRRDRGDRADLSAPMPTPDAPPPTVGESEELPEGVTVEESDGGRRRAVRVRRRGDDGGCGGRSMRVVLREDVEKLGRKGDLLEVADGYARNFLVPRGLAIVATKGVVDQASAMRRNRQIRDDRDKEAAQELATRLTTSPIQVTARAGEGGKLFGSVTAADIVVAVKEQTRVEIDRRKITLAEPLKALGPAEVPVQLHADVTVAMAVEVVAE